MNIKKYAKDNKINIKPSKYEKKLTAILRKNGNKNLKLALDLQNFVWEMEDAITNKK